jgi:hypothetical protein
MPAACFAARRLVARRLPRAVLAAGLLASVAGLAGCGWLGRSSVAEVKPNTFVLRGEVTIAEPAATSTPGAVCAAPPGAEVIVAGAAVTITDPAGHRIGVGSLESGHLASTSAGTVCAFGFQIAPVPGGVDTYTVTVDGSATRTFSATDLRQGGLAVIMVQPSGRAVTG